MPTMEFNIPPDAVSNVAIAPPFTIRNVTVRNIASLPLTIFDSGGNILFQVDGGSLISRNVNTSRLMAAYGAVTDNDAIITVSSDSGVESASFNPNIGSTLAIPINNGPFANTNNPEIFYDTFNYVPGLWTVLEVALTLSSTPFLPPGSTTWSTVACIVEQNNTQLQVVDADITNGAGLNLTNGTTKTVDYVLINPASFGLLKGRHFGLRFNGAIATQAAQVTITGTLFCKRTG